jgi:uncharacterized lipoprotein YddW (UPF0748 family)
MRYRLLLLALLLTSLHLPAHAGDTLPAPRREFRGVWVASVSNIDWPSRKGLSGEQQKAELLALLDKAAALKLNAVILQVRPMADALYASKREPWSEFLTGRAGQAPEPFYDPLELAVREAHARGLELHAWFNPYRARHPSATGPVPADHLIKTRPDLARPYGKHYWLNPTSAEVQDHSLNVILDVVRRYDVDGVHIDDYFYPYKEKDAAGKTIPFPDDDTWAAYQKAGGKLGRDDWRRDAVNRFIERMYREVKAARPWVKVGISPFGIWRPGHPEGITGLDQYAELYADAKLWLNQGWVDYFSPQLYWPIRQEKQSYPKLLDWWMLQNTKGRLMCPGNYTSRVTGKEKGWPASEIVEQIKVTRETGAGGNVHFSMKALLQDTGGIAEALRAVYAEPALVPSLPWTKDKQLAPPALRSTSEKGDRRLPRSFELEPAPGQTARLILVRSQVEGKWSIRIVPIRAGQRSAVTLEAAPTRLVITLMDRYGREGEPLRLPE